VGTSDRTDHVEIPDLAEALRNNPEAASIWERLPAAHRRGHVIAIQRITGDDARAERIAHTLVHLVEKYAS
jgi:uncharacterized protein YdeI (YjbR/CyaY-like superfamily)